MRPSQIRRTAETSLQLLEWRGHGTPDALLLAWVAWEGLKIRTVCVGLARMGFQVQHVYDVLSEEKVHALDDYRRLFKSVFGSFPESAKGVGKQWQELEDLRDTRHKIVHGMGSDKPDRLERGTRLLAGAAMNPDWLAPLSVVRDDVRVPIGSPFAAMRSPGRRPKYELREMVVASRPTRRQSW
ncbi:MAG: hypothetical protein WCP26_12910 [Actinomycetes bacterium]